MSTVNAAASSSSSSSPFVQPSSSSATTGSSGNADANGVSAIGGGDDVSGGGAGGGGLRDSHDTADGAASHHFAAIDIEDAGDAGGDGLGETLAPGERTPWSWP